MPTVSWVSCYLVDIEDDIIMYNLIFQRQKTENNTNISNHHDMLLHSNYVPGYLAK